MSCYHPLRGIVLGTKPDGKKIIKVVKSDFSFELDNPDVPVEYVSIPCGHCIGCRLKYSRIWADRCMAEAQYHDSNYFLTLTYQDDYLPKQRKLEDGTLSPIHSLNKRDLQLFIKRLRSKLSDQTIRYYACGEYGPKNMRPHFHVILFGCKLDDLQSFYKSERSFKYYTSDTIASCWHPESDSSVTSGFHSITNVTWDTCAYTARYITKKQYGETSSVYSDYNFEPEFTLMSRKPGIGRQYYDDHCLDIYYGNSYIPTDRGSVTIKPNKYYDSLFDIDYPECMKPLREDRKEIAIANECLKSNLTSLSYLDRLSSEEENLTARTKILKRKDV